MVASFLTLAPLVAQRGGASELACETAKARRGTAVSLGTEYLGEAKEGELVARRLALSLVVVGVIVSLPVFAQVTLTRFKGPFLTSDQIVEKARTESDAASLISQALAYKTKGMVYPITTIMVIGSQIPQEWLPVVSGVQFQRLDDDAAREHLQQCGKLMYITDLRFEASGLAAVAVAEGDRCSTVGNYVLLQQGREGWRQTALGVGGGFGGGVGDCGCPRK